jgi:hypothetical protein
MQYGRPATGACGQDVRAVQVKSVDTITFNGVSVAVCQAVHPEQAVMAMPGQLIS